MKLDAWILYSILVHAHDYTVYLKAVTIYRKHAPKNCYRDQSKLNTTNCIEMPKKVDGLN